jgi:hypothetical protein
MCQEHPDHTDSEVIAGKLWLIGRAYAASPERGSGRARAGQDPDFFSYLAQSGAWGGLDARLDPLKNRDGFSMRSLPEILATHVYLVDLLSELIAPRLGGERQPRGHTSFASKYLHFHAPDHFPIYDSYVNSAIARHYPRARPDLNAGSVDPRYSRFCQLALIFQSEHARTSTLREMDRTLYQREREYRASQQSAN